MSLFSHHTKNSPESHDHSGREVKEEHPFAEIVRFSIIAILIVIPVRMFVAQPFIVSGASMDDTFHSGEYLIVDQISYYFEKPERGEVIIFRYPRDPKKFFIKRVIGLPGDTVTIEDGKVEISNEKHPAGFTIDEPYIDEMDPAPVMTRELGKDEYFVMGDNRNHSSDSRTWGVLQEEQIIGKALVRLFPPSRVDYLPGKYPIAEPAQTEVVNNN